MPTSLARPRRPGRGTLLPAAASSLAPDWLHGPPAPARVVAAFDRAGYLLRDGDADVLPLLAPGALALPGGLRVADPAHLDALGLAQGQEVEVGHGRVLAADGGLVVRRTWAPPRVPLAELAPPARERARSATEPFLDLVRDMGDAAALAAAPSPADPGCARHARHFRPPGCRCTRAVGAAGRVAGMVNPDAASAVGGLVGLGPGLTPAGDDVLCGVLLGLRAAGREHDRAVLERLVLPLLGRTTALSATLLRQAARGYAVPPVVTLLRAWHRDETMAALSALGSDVAAVGHTSGPALLLGLRAALAAPHSLDDAALPTVLNHTTMPLPTTQPAAAAAAGTRGPS